MFALYFGRAWDEMGQKWQYLAKKANFGPNLAVYGPKILIFSGGSKSFGTCITQKPSKQLARIAYWSGMGPNGPKMPMFGQKSQFWAKFSSFWANIISLVFFASKRIFHFYAPEAILAKSLTQSRLSMISWLKSIHKRGPSLDPWGTPALTSRIILLAPSIRGGVKKLFFVLSVKKLS